MSAPKHSEITKREGAGVEDGPLIGCDQAIEHPGVIAHNELVLSGWAASPDGISGVVVQIDDRLLHAAYGLETPWVADAMPEVPGAAQAGYSLRLDTSKWTSGAREVTIAAFDSEGRRGEISGEVRFLPFEEPKYTTEENRAAIAAGEVAMWLEEPRIVEGRCEVEGFVEVSGWAWSEQGLEAVLVTVDGCATYEALRPIVRPDLLDDHGESVAGEAGFVLRLHPRECPPGPHTLTVVAIRADGEAVGIEGSVVCLPEPEPMPAPVRGEAVEIDWLEDRRRPRKRDDSHERYDPERHAGLVLEAEHQLRYRWALQIAEGRTVLDAGCGVGWGAALLAEGGAERVMALDVDEEALGAARQRMEGLAVELKQGDVQALPFEDATFDLVTCFQVLEQTSDPGLALEELRRILRPNGVLLISTEVRRAGRHGLTSSELERALCDRFSNVSLRRQRVSLASTLLGDERDGAATVELSLLGERRPGGEAHVVAIAGDCALPPLGDLGVLASPRATRRLHDAALTWESRALQAEADSAASRNMANLAQLHQQGTVELLCDSQAKAREELAALRAQGDRTLSERDAARSELDTLGQTLDGAQRELASQAARLEERENRLDEAERRLVEVEGAFQTMAAQMEARERSLSWRLTRPLRWTKRRALLTRNAMKPGGRS